MSAQEEKTIRRELAAAYRLAALSGWGEDIATHMSARLPDGAYLINPADVNIHAGPLGGRTDINRVMHLHTRDGVAGSALENGVLPLNQNALNNWPDAVYHDYEGIVNAGEERERLLTDLGQRYLLFLRNHGTLTVGRSIASAFYRLKLSTHSTGAKPRLPPRAVLDKQKQMMCTTWFGLLGEQRFWPAMLRRPRANARGLTQDLQWEKPETCKAVPVSNQKCRNADREGQRP